MKMRHVVESPIEVMMLAALYRVLRSDGGIQISTQREVVTVSGTYRLDLVLESGERRIAVECDGAEWHGSPAQRERDAARDAALADAGWRVVRFSGSEITRDAEGCAIKASTELLGSSPARTSTVTTRRPWRAGPSGAPADRVRLVLPGAAADALGLLAAFPELAPVAEEENLAGLLAAGPLVDLARDLIHDPMGLDAALARLASVADEWALDRMRALAGPGRPDVAAAAGQFRRACVKAAIEVVVAEQGRLHAEIARLGSPVPDDLLVKAQVAARRRSDLERRLRSEGLTA